MSKRSFLFGTLVVLAGLAFATPSRAGSVVTTSVSFQASSPGLTDIIFTYSAPGGLGTLTGLTPTTLPGVVGGTVTQTSPGVVDLNFPSGDTGPFPATGSFVFTMMDSNFNPVSGIPSFLPAGVSLTSFSFSISSIPEPASLALLGIGMTGLLAFRRFFKKTSVA
jgi:hypothetical protein